MRRNRVTAGMGLVLLAALAAVAPALAGPEPVRAQIVGYGEYESLPHVRIEDAPGTAAGAVGVVERDPPLVARTTAIVAAEGVSFGVQVSAPTLGPDQTVPVTVRLDHPPITAPDGRVWRTQTSDGLLTREPRFRGFCFDHAWELAAGEWTYTFLHEGRPIARQSFTLTVDPNRRVEGRCSPEPGIS